MTKKLLQWAKAAALFCGVFMLNACAESDNPVDGMTGASSIAMIVKNGNIGYFQQVEKSFRDVCNEKDYVGFYYSISNETAYQEQVAAVAELRKQDIRKLRGIIFSPSFGPNGENAEAEVAALAEELGIPVVILDSPVKSTSPLASSPYFGTDNTAAGKAMAEKVAADKVAVFAMKGSPGIERAEAFKAVKPNATVYQVAEKCNDEVQAVLDDFDDFVFFNGNDLVNALPMLKAAGKRVYTFDVYSEFLDELIAGSSCLNGIMAQNTFGMARKAVEAIIANAKQGEMLPTFYITSFNLDDENVKPFLDFYNKQ
jgi:ABC-type sugar transport system substrate-binding protein